MANVANALRIKRHVAMHFKQERIKGTEKAFPYTPYSIGNSSRVILRIGTSRAAWRFRGGFA